MILILILTENQGLKNYLKKWKNERDDLDQNPTDHALQLFLKAVAAKYTSNALIVIDENGKVRSWNKGAEAMFGWTEKEMYDHDISVIIPRRYQEYHNRALRNYRDSGIIPNIGRKIDIEGLRKDGSELPIQVTIHIDKSLTSITFFSGVIVDRTEIVEIQRNFSKKKNEYNTFERILKSGGFKWDLTTDSVEFTPGAIDLLEIEEDESYTANVLMKRIHVEDRKIVNTQIQEAFKKGKGYCIKYRSKKLNEEIVKREVRGEPIFDNIGSVIGFIGTIQQITDDND